MTKKYGRSCVNVRGRREKTERKLKESFFVLGSRTGWTIQTDVGRPQQRAGIAK